ncbi:CRISPR-associated helicase Cas3' [bacterium]|nr:CRISPR-associated helicase Cas3' [bacterium]MCP5463050.1 CRISPR-associated helicase Cas3' [bacterium]
MSDFLAHSKSDVTGDIDPLNEHLTKTATIAESFGKTNQEKKILELLGYFHDIGKYRKEFQTYLREGGQRGSVPHSIYGAYLAYQKKINIAAFCIAGHHKGLPDSTGLKNDLKNETLLNETCNLEKAFQNDIEKNISDLIPSPLNFGDCLLSETYTRFFFSCLVDADWLATESHFSPHVYTKRISKTININEKITILDRYISKFPVDGDINFLRNTAREDANKLACKPIGFYSLNLPTGLGKTLCSVSWALRHAHHNDLKRIIIVLPYTSIIDQSAKLLKEIFGEEEILEHHSTFEFKDGSNPTYKKLSAENWDFPFILTTNVQFFESIFSNKPSKCRKVHNISNSIVIFDEVQSLPKDKFLPTITMLKNLKDIFKTSFLFCTATQPAFASREGFSGIDGIVSLVISPARYYTKTKRVDYSLFRKLSQVTLDDIGYEIDENGSSTLVVFNTKKDTMGLYNQDFKSFDKKYHLSTAMCPAHRKRKIDAIKNDLVNHEKKIIVCSTQLIEAGVDLDFPVVFRALSPLDSIIQSAGRCNREGKLSKGDVFIFKLAEQKYPTKTYELVSNFTEMFLQRDGLDILHSHDSYERYFMELDNFIKWDKGKIDDLRKNFLFEQVADTYKIIDSPAQTVVVPYNKGEKLISELGHKPFLSRSDFQKLQLYSVQMYPNQFEESLSSGLIQQSPNGLFFIWIGKYSDDVGVVFDTTEAIDLVI